MNFQTIITPATLADNLGKTDWLILDCRRYYLNNSTDHVTLLNQQIPNAYFNCDEKNQFNRFWSNITDFSLSETEQGLAELKVLGFNLDTQIILYEETNGVLTNSLWLKLRSIGIPNVAVLQGGFNAWKEKKLPISSTDKEYNNKAYPHLLH